MGLKKYLKKAGKAYLKYSSLGLINYTAPALTGKYVRKWLMPKLPSVDTGIGGNQAYSIEGRQNVPARNSPQNEHFGTGRRWPEYKSQPWTFYRNNDQVLCMILFVGVGEYECSDLRVGQTSFGAYPAAAHEIYGPGVPVTLFHPNVYTNDEVSSVELKPGALETVVFTNSSVNFNTSGRISGLDHQGKRARKGSELIVADTATHDGTYTVVDVDGDGHWIDVTPVFGSSTTEPATITFQRYVSSDDIFSAKDVALTVTASPKRFAATADKFLGFVVGDTIGTEGAGANDEVLFVITAIAGDASYIEVDLTPTAGSWTADVILQKRWQGWYAVCPPDETVDKIQIDLVALSGLGKVDGDDTKSVTVTVDVEYREIDDSGAAIGSPVAVSVNVTDSRRDPVRRTVDITPASSGRYEVRISRATPKSTKSEVLDGLEWGGLRGFYVDDDGSPDDTFEGCTVIALQLTASGQLSAQNESAINMLITRKLPIWDGDSWSAPTATRSIAWAHAYMLKTCGVADADIDLAAHLEAAADWEANGWFFDHDFDAETNLMDARRLMLRLAKAVPTRDPITGQYSFRRDEPRAPVLMLTDSNSEAGTYTLTKRDASAATGSVLRYMDPLTWTTKEVEVGDADTKPAIDTLYGCTSRQQAWEIANYEWAAERYRNRSIDVDAELEPILLQYDDAILLQSASQRWGQCAEVVSVDGSTLQVWPPVDWADSGNYVYLRSPEGVPGAQISVTRGDSDEFIVLGDDADVEIITADGEERTRLIFGYPGNEPVIALTRAVSWSLGDNGGQQASIDTVLDDERVYADPGDAPEL